MKRIFIGPANLANFSNYIQRSLNKVGLEADFITWSNSTNQFNYCKQKIFSLVNKPPFKIFGKNIFYFLNQYFLKPLYFSYALLRYDIFFFIKPSTFFRNNSDLKILRLFKKKIAIVYAGCSDRDILFDTDQEYVCNMCKDIKKQKDNLCNNVAGKISQIEFFSKQANFIFGYADNVSYVKDKRKVHQAMIGLPEIRTIKKDFSGRLRISHLPSNPLVKGTDIIEPVMRRLANEEDIDIVIKKEIWSREKILLELESTHILIDSLAGYTFGMLSLEGIQYGCVVLNSYPDWIAQYYEIPPVVKITGDTLYITLKSLLYNRDLLTQYVIRSQQAYNKYFTYDAAGNYYKKIFGLD